MTKSKSSFLITATVLSSMFLAAACLYVGSEVKDAIPMENPSYEKHKKNIVTFSHKKHAEDYTAENPELFKNGCGACHHNENNEPLADLKDGDSVQNCIVCHKTPANPTKPKKGEPSRLTIKERLTYHAYAIHHSCEPCHKAYNEAGETNGAPTTCTGCHPEES